MLGTKQGGRYPTNSMIHYLFILLLLIVVVTEVGWGMDRNGCVQPIDNLRLSLTPMVPPI